jgi:hypothetical protein
MYRGDLGENPITKPRILKTIPNGHRVTYSKPASRGFELENKVDISAIVTKSPPIRVEYPKNLAGIPFRALVLFLDEKPR